MVCASAKRRTGGQKTAQLVHRATMATRTVSHVLAALREQGKMPTDYLSVLLRGLMARLNCSALASFNMVASSVTSVLRDITTTLSAHRVIATCSTPRV